MDNLYNDLLASPNAIKRITSKGLQFIYYICPPIASKYSIHTDQNYFLYVLRGKKVLHTGDNSFTLLPGTVVMVRKGAYVMEWFDHELEIIIIFIPEAIIRNIINDVRPHYRSGNRTRYQSELVIWLKTNSAMVACLDSLLPYFLQVPEPSDYILELKFREFILNIILNQGNQKVIDYFSECLEETRSSVQEIMEEHFMENQSLSDYARLSGRSLASFKIEFRKLYAISPGRWILQKRLEFARMLLATTHKNISEVASESGFENNTHFSRVYKDKFGMPPNQFRKSILLSAKTHKLEDPSAGQ
jgi:AraC family transcriptional regulator, exoenzyme S synthesis regulatory protein ExsA